MKKDIGGLTNWLFQNSGEVIRYRLVNENFINKEAVDLKELHVALLKNTYVQFWLENLKQSITKSNQVHGSFDWQFENAMLKLIHLGLHSGISQLDEIVEFYIEYLDAQSLKRKNKREHFDSIIVASILLRAGYTNDIVIDFMKTSLEVIYEFITRENYNIYVEDKSKFNGIPKKWRDRPIVKPEIIKEYGFGYPMIYDVIGLSYLFKELDDTIDKMIDSVIQYILCDDFHNNIIDGYGIMFDGLNKYYSMGWDPKLPGYYNVNEYMLINPEKLLFVADIMSNYPLVLRTKWYNDVLLHLECFKTEQQRYCFPKEYLLEKKGYAVNGLHLGLGENRRNKKWREVESTFLMLRLIRNIQD